MMESDESRQSCELLTCITISLLTISNRELFDLMSLSYASRVRFERFPPCGFLPFQHSKSRFYLDLFPFPENAHSTSLDNVRACFRGIFWENSSPFGVSRYWS
jgi:hypothetical protein